MVRDPLIWKSTALRAIIVALVALFTVLGAQRAQESNRFFDVFDEAAHLDYVFSLSQGHIPAWGDRLTQHTLQLISCIGNQFYPDAGDCSLTARDPENVAALGFSYEAQQPPLGYLAFLPAMLRVDSISPQFQLNWMRDIGGIVTVAVSSFLLFGIATAMRLSLLRTAVLSCIIMLAPISIHAYSTVSNDSAALNACLLFSLGLVHFGDVIDRPTRRLWIPAIVGALVGLSLGLTKSFLIVVPAAVALILLISQAYPSLKLRHRPKFLEGLLTPRSVYVWMSLVAATASTVAFQLWQTRRATVPSSTVLDILQGFMPKVDSIQIQTIVDSTANIINNWFGDTNGIISGAGTFFLLNALLLICAGIAAYASKSRAYSLTFQAWLVASVLLATSWHALQFFQGHYNFTAPPRYGLVTLPFFAIAVSAGFRVPKLSFDEKSD